MDQGRALRSGGLRALGGVSSPDRDHAGGTGDPFRQGQSPPGSALRRLDAAVLEAVRADQDLAHRFEILKSIPGVGEITAMAILIEMPELGTLNAKEAASLAGLAPATRQSGKWQGNERIQGGRSALRHSIFMPALTAIGYNDEFRAKYSALITAGKAPKVAVTAVMRKIIVLANALIRDGRKWAPNPA